MFSKVFSATSILRVGHNNSVCEEEKIFLRETKPRIKEFFIELTLFFLKK